jgi:hypothetical protein
MAAMLVARRLGTLCVGLCLLSRVAHAEGPEEGGTVSVRLDSDDERATLERHVDGEIESGAEPWREICITPCTAHVRPDAALRVGGQRLNPSKPFHLPEGRSEVSVKADVGTKAQTAWGYVFMLGGGGVAVNGAAFLLMGSVFPSDRDTQNIGHTFTTIGAVTLGIGLVAVVGGIVLVTTDDTTVQVAKKRGPRFALPGGLELRPNGFVF